RPRCAIAHCPSHVLLTAPPLLDALPLCREMRCGLLRYLPLLRTDTGDPQIRVAEKKHAQIPLRPRQHAQGQLQPHGRVTVEGRRSEEHTAELQSRFDTVCPPLLHNKIPT